MAHIPHIEQLREMMRRERAIGGPAERTFESLLGLQLRPKRLREAADLWESITSLNGPHIRDGKWTHPDMLPALADANTAFDSSATQQAAGSADSSATSEVDWDAELSKLLDEDAGGSDSSKDAHPENDEDDE